MKIDWSKSRETISEENQLAAVQQNGYALQFCHQPSEAVQIAAVQQDGDVLRYCHQPSEAVQQNGIALQYFKRAWVKETIQKITVEEIESLIGFEIEIIAKK